MTSHLRILALVLGAAVIYGLLKLYLRVLRRRVLPNVDPEAVEPPAGGPESGNGEGSERDGRAE